MVRKTSGFWLVGRNGGGTINRSWEEDKFARKAHDLSLGQAESE